MTPLLFRHHLINLRRGIRESFYSTWSGLFSVTPSVNRTTLLQEVVFNPYSTEDGAEGCSVTSFWEFMGRLEPFSVRGGFY